MLPASMKLLQKEKEIAKKIEEAKAYFNKTIQNKIASNVESIHSIANKLCNLKQKMSPADKITMSDK